MNQAMYPPQNNYFGNFQQPQQNPGGFQQVPQNLPQPNSVAPNPGQQYGANIHQNNVGYNDKIDPIFNTGFAFNNLMTVGYVKRTSLDINKKDYKDRHFFFISMIAGVGQGQNRTYDFSKRVSMKFSMREISSLAFILKQCAIGNHDNVLPYMKFSSDSKNCSIWIETEPKTFNNRQVILKKICIAINSRSTDRLTIALSPAEAYGIGETFEFLFNEAMKAELEIQQAEPKGELEGNYADSFTPPTPAGFAQNGIGQQMSGPPAGNFNQGAQSVQYPTQQPGGYSTPPMGQYQQPPMGQPAVTPTNPAFGTAAEQTQQAAAQFGQMLNTQFQR